MSMQVGRGAAVLALLIGDYSDAPRAWDRTLAADRS